ncbi:hypothetical protein SAMN02745181_0319 [Rubritalea squalenifaciens DSM 18772]|uniref:Uncharacterized protein n=1 Tax=Rubritalea squalenifaciens DSM 18772 TaxID=1123071 RepID=A0A1M6BVC5_9BACT|nr:hypothetical protein [Rubritalea squalenifaciens]SHI52699.1 hypothetical protein SAMN02745181_0319 [Rubritalea squalenifaciens DSM 18772]
MKYRWIIILALLILSITGLGVISYAYMEPQSPSGLKYLKFKYDPSEPDLESISKQLFLTNGGHIPPTFDDFLFERLNHATMDSEEYKNILGFYATQSRYSRAGRNIYAKGESYLPSIITYGKQALTEERQTGFLFLAYGIAKKKELYKPSLYGDQSPLEYLQYIEKGRLDEVYISSP